MLHDQQQRRAVFYCTLGRFPLISRFNPLFAPFEEILEDKIDEVTILDTWHVGIATQSANRAAEVVSAIGAHQKEFLEQNRDHLYRKTFEGGSRADARMLLKLSRNGCGAATDIMIDQQDRNQLPEERRRMVFLSRTQVLY